jgi:hypothetical protein
MGNYNCKNGKIMSEEKRMNYNIDVNLNISVKIFEKIKNTALNQPPRPHNAKLLPEIKSNSKILKFRQLKHPTNNIDTVYNCYGNLSVLG